MPGHKLAVQAPQRGPEPGNISRLDRSERIIRADDPKILDKPGISTIFLDCGWTRKKFRL